jgi:Zn-dependent alcohol dehydrogenase
MTIEGRTVLENPTVGAVETAPSSVKIEIDPMITYTVPLSGINRAFDLMQEGKSIRSVVTFRSVVTY